MEGFLESFLYLLITIIILVLSMRKKKPREYIEEAEETRTDDPFRDIFADQEDEEYAEAEGHPEVIQQEYRKQPEAEVTWMTESDAEDSIIDADQIMKEAADNNPIAQEDIAEIDAYGVRETEGSGIQFNLKKAVIYSVILERKTF